MNPKLAGVGGDVRTGRTDLELVLHQDPNIDTQVGGGSSCLGDVQPYNRNDCTRTHWPGNRKTGT